MFVFFRRIPAFYSSPVFVKSNPVVVYRGSLLKPKSFACLPRKETRQPNLTLEDYQEALYRNYVENRPRLGFGRHQRRILPSIAENSVTLNSKHVLKFSEVDEAAPTERQSKQAAFDIKTVYSASSLDELVKSRTRPKRISDSQRTHFYDSADNFADSRSHFEKQSEEFFDTFADARSGGYDDESGDFFDTFSEDFDDAR